jgi:putative Mg2+ transporter-C (MgtC) family protein
MPSLLALFDLQRLIEFSVKILLSLLLGGLVGLERERRNRPAGLRTFMLVSVGSCIYTLVSLYGFPGADPARIAAPVVSGVGFIGAGEIIRNGATLRGLTTAAGIWTVAAVGMAIGTGQYFVALFGTIAILLVLAALRRWFKRGAEDEL